MAIIQLTVAISAAFLIFGTFYTVWRMCLSTPPKFVDEDAPPVSILKPLCGTDPGLLENLESFLHLDYPEYEIIFFVASADDPAVKVLEELHARHPTVSFKIVLSDTHVGPNPKVANLDKAWSVAKFDVVLCSDSNVRAERTYLRSAVPLLVNDVGIVSGYVNCFGAVDFGGYLEEATWNTFYARWPNIAEALGVGFVIGKSMLFRRSVAAEFGGLSSFADHVAEDYMMGISMNRIGKKVAVKQSPVMQYVGSRTLTGYWQRALRWNLLQKYSAPVVFFLTPLQFPVVLIALTTAVGSTRLSAYIATLWFAMDMTVLAAMGTRPRPLAWLVSQLAAPAIWLHALTQRKVVWRGNTMKIGKGGWLRL